MGEKASGRSTRTLSSSTDEIPFTVFEGTDPDFREFLAHIRGSKLHISLKPGINLKNIMALGLGGATVSAWISHVLQGSFHIFSVLVNYLCLVLTLIAYYSFRVVRPKYQRRLNEELGNTINDATNPILYLRPFKRAGTFLVRNNLPSRVDRALMGKMWDFELALSLVVASVYELVAIGSTRKGYGSAKLLTEDETWTEVFADAANRARMIFIIPHNTPGTLWETEQIVSRPDWLRKTVFFMPPSHRGHRHARDWEHISSVLKEKGIPLPHYDPAGSFFIMDAEKRCTLIPHYNLESIYTFSLVAYLDYLLRKSERFVTPEEIRERLSAIQVKEPNYFLNEISALANSLISLLIIALIIRGSIVQAFKMPSGSMLPTLQIGDHILVNKFLYGLRLPWPVETMLVQWGQPRQGDVIVFIYPKDRTKDFIQRVIAIGGDTVEVRHKQVRVNGVTLDIPQATYEDQEIPGLRDNYGPVTVPPHKLFVMGDNRDRSHDSRFWGFLDLEDVKGKAFLIYWSWDGEDRWVRWERIGSSIR